jgi:hypothetical protein
MGERRVRRYLVERYLPGTTPTELSAAEVRVAEAVASVRACGLPLDYLGSTYIPDEETSFMRFEGALEGVQRACHLAGLGVARIVEVEEVEP